MSIVAQREGACGKTAACAAALQSAAKQKHPPHPYPHPWPTRMAGTNWDFTLFFISFSHPHFPPLFDEARRAGWGGWGGVVRPKCSYPTTVIDHSAAAPPPPPPARCPFHPSADGRANSQRSPITRLSAASLWIQSTKSILLTSALVHIWHFLQFSRRHQKHQLATRKWEGANDGGR